ncbi:SMODS domain-containing nucleotidyltransferase [Flavobacterium yafengii]|uniref:SMODS domain-containing nucleotidyltransferase n=1 Tax=Flavobacterium yafengii TaxID=3041253 RepID=UPI0024A8A4FC|nr:nucleotidyltransferase domain-containing protein [Flavobacterium yafengii]MDI5897635.1 nucleotidyltransferase domain-containing protein [Flavobacterium yafengii]
MAATINYKLQVLSSTLFIKNGSTERTYIDQKILNLKTNIRTYFGNAVNDVLIFGSFKRDTILPRYYDESSDVDFLIIFNQAEREFIPETYRTRIRKFADTKYATSTVIKDHPSVVLEMNKIKFDLVPCRIAQSFFTNTYQIPDKNGSWMNTDPLGFSEKLTSANTKYNSLVKPLIRLFKRWNAHNNYPFSTFELEQIIANMNFSGDNYEKGFLYVIGQLSSSGLSIYNSKKIETLKTNGQWIREYLDRDNQEKAIEVVYRILGLKYN